MRRKNDPLLKMLKKRWYFLFFPLLILASVAYSASLANSNKSGYVPITVQDSTDRERSLKLFGEVAAVLRHPRCINCHPSDDYPRQGDEMRRHMFNVQRGNHGKGVIGMKCISCHGASNNLASGVPGAPEPDDPLKSRWHLAPLSMGWIGLNDAQLGKRLLDKEQNGNMSPQDLVEHMEEDPLVLWGWDPGEGREPIPIPHDEFVEILKEWVATGAQVPTEDKEPKK
ncbi:hypothetical protein J8281_06590 [Aquimarina sp. U1-2]|uniref:hypothetical protein n=1 Tax=Aquimarina sp. U1-2 TaxID=2823141 RepID=UPI001AECF65F|nr:hypothetical protein [Aquimarina sp. U1-2]MBP2831853.1 hypothetical protein [Aquimarina sp. U1-2]